MAATVLEKYTWLPTVRRTSTGAAISGVDVHVWDDTSPTPVKVVNGLSTNASGQIAEQELQKASHSVSTTTTTTTTTTPHLARFVKYNEVAIQFNQNIQAAVEPTFYTDTQNNITQTTKATVLAYNGITITHASDLVTLATGAATRVDDMNKLYDRLQAEAEDSPQYDYLEILATVDKQNYQMFYDLVVNNVAFDGQSRTIAFQGTADLTLQGASVDVSDLAVTGDVNLGTGTGGIALDNLDVSDTLDFSVAGTYDLTNCQIGEVTNSSGGSVTINALGDTSITTNTGPNITINNAVTATVGGMSEGAAVKVIAEETVGSVTLGDVLMEKLSDSNGEASFTHNYEGDLDVTVRCRASGLPTAAIADDNGSYTDETTAANQQTVDDMNLLPTTPVVNQDGYLFGHAEEFNQLKINISTVGVGGGTITWQYWNGAWTNLSGVSDGTQSFSQSGTNYVSWTMPSDWATTTINSQGPYKFVRARFTAGSFSTAPKGKKCSLDVNRYLPFVQTFTITSTGLNAIVTWIRDTIARF